MKIKKITALILAIVLLVSALPSGSINVGAEDQPIYSGGTYYYYTLSNNEATIVEVFPSISGEIVIPSVLGDCPVTAIGDKAFYHAYNITKITVPGCVKTIGESAFSLCSALKSVVISDGVTAIDDYAFYYCDELKSIVLPDSVKDIGSSAFYSCKKLVDITLPANITKIGYRLFRECLSLKSITIPSGVKEIAQEAFYSCDALESITLPSGLTSIGYNAFFFCGKLKDINLPSGLTEIKGGAFGWCESFTTVNIPASVKTIEDGAFQSCSNISSFTVDKGNKYYYSSDNCLIETATKRLIFACNTDTIIVDRNVAIIDGGFNYDNSKITTIVIPKSVKTISSYAFAGCANLSTIYYTGSQAEWNSISVGTGNDKLSSVNIIYNYTPPYTPGDIDDNGNIDLQDVVVLAQYVAGWSVNCNEDALNVNGAGGIDLQDVVLLAQYIAGWSGIILY